MVQTDKTTDRAYKRIPQYKHCTRHTPPYIRARSIMLQIRHNFLPLNYRNKPDMFVVVAGELL